MPRYCVTVTFEGDLTCVKSVRINQNNELVVSGMGKDIVRIIKYKTGYTCDMLYGDLVFMKDGHVYEASEVIVEVIGAGESRFKYTYESIIYDIIVKQVPLAAENPGVVVIWEG